MEKIIYQIEVTADTDMQIKSIIKGMELNPIYENTITIEDFIKGALWEFLTMIDQHNESASIMGILTDSKHKNYQIKNRFKEIMKEKKMKQVDLVKLTDINKTNLSQILNNKYAPGLDSFLRIWAALEYPNITDAIYIEYVE